jgi:hypothetical protein
MPTGHSLAPLADVPDSQRRDGGSELVIRRKIVGLLVWEHALVRPDDLSRVNQAFFTANAAIGLVLLAAIAADLWI